MPKRTDKLLIDDMIKAIEEINDFVAGYDYSMFLSDAKTKAAVVRNLEVIGEASILVSEPLQLQFPLIEWKNMRLFRNKLIHEYFGIDYGIVWNVIQNELPKNLEMLKRLHTVI